MFSGLFQSAPHEFYKFPPPAKFAGNQLMAQIWPAAISFESYFVAEKGAGYIMKFRTVVLIKSPVHNPESRSDSVRNETKINDVSLITDYRSTCRACSATAALNHR